MLSIRLLGPPLIEHDGQLLRIQRRIPRALLFYLATIGGAVGRGELLFLFWPEEDDEKAREHLRDNLAKLRAALPDPDLIQASTETVSLEFSRLTVDVLEFRRLIEQAGPISRKLPEGGLLSASAYYALSEAVRLWRSPTFMAGADLSISAPFDEWLSRTDHVLQLTYQQALERLADHETATGNNEKAAEWLRRALELDPYNEDLHHRLLTTLLDMGARNEALLHLTALKNLLDRELGLPPGEKILDLEKRLRQSASPEIGPRKAAWPLRPTVQVPFVGQFENLERLQRAYRRGGGVIIFGEAGAGKTRLVQEFYQRLKAAPRLMIASCRPTEINLPFQPWIELLRHNVSREEWLQVPSVWASHLSLLLPELIALRPDLSAVPDASSDQMRAALFEAIRSLLVSQARQWPLLLFFDNIHWGDEASLDALAYLLERGVFGAGNGLLVMAARTEETNPFLDHFLLSVSPAFHLDSLEVSRLEVEEIAELAHHVLGKRPPARLVERLAQDTGGNPFFLLETLQAVLDLSPQLDLEAVDSLPLASSVHQLIQSRLQRLPAQTRELLMAAAVLGSEFQVTLLEKVAGDSPEEVARALEELENARLLHITSHDETLTYAFSHEKIRESLLQELSPARKRVLHLRTARSLAEHFGAEKERCAAMLAFHYEEALDFAEAFDAWVQAGQYAQRLSSFADASAAFQRAERLIPRTAALGDEQIYRLYLEWGAMLSEINDTLTLRRIYQTLMRIAVERHSDLLTGKALDGLSEACFTVNQFEEGLQYNSQALPYLKKSGHLFSQMEALTHRGLYLYMLNQVEEAQEVFREALEIAPHSEDPLLLQARGHTNYRMASTYILSGWPRDALQYAERSLRDYSQAGQRHGQVMTHVVLSMANHFLGDFAIGRTIAQAGIELAERFASWRTLGDLHICSSFNELDLGELGAAWQSAQKALALGTKHGHHDIVAAAYRACGDIYRHLGAFNQAVNMYKRGIEMGGQHFAALENLLRMGFTLIQKGDTIGEVYFQQATRRATEMRIGMITFYARGCQLLILARQKNFDLLEPQLETFREEASARGWNLSLVIEKYLQALVARARDHLEEAEALCQEIIAAGQELGCPRAELRGLILLHEVVQQQGRSGEETRQRVQAILSAMQASLGDAPLHDIWEEYQQKVLTALH